MPGVYHLLAAGCTDQGLSQGQVWCRVCSMKYEVSWISLSDYCLRIVTNLLDQGAVHSHCKIQSCAPPGFLDLLNPLSALSLLEYCGQLTVAIRRNIGNSAFIKYGTSVQIILLLNNYFIQIILSSNINHFMKHYSCY